MLQEQPFAEQHVQASHLDALFRFGEFVAFILKWSATDFERGLVERCPACVQGDRVSAAYDSARVPDCPECLGTSYAGGWRAWIVRPAILADRDPETTKDRRAGEIERETINLQTTSDFYTRPGDLMVRSSGHRYRLGQMDTEVIRSGFNQPRQRDITGGKIGRATLESDSVSIEKAIPMAQIKERIRTASLSGHLALGVTWQDEMRAPLVPAEA